ncbi:hypothetical protein CC117_07185 [Parafrankia colletiae]|uniref:PPM-type phosphatase domain-containing protein n=1 Tax=Parafrankia colletiae TaxID=573497 RepID=A0A1S1QAS1_9ACTN|nr:hypothetical protein [Parafrankia colletiae]MCK9899649.1 hypothetical protein [Frankia sp. Cpl3]OHV30686.1 hypothetical protein CC117_07185 [Parafrankia colletiae]
MRVMVAKSWSRKACNEDAVGSRADGAWVIDGASALEPGPLVEGLPGAAWVSSVASSFLTDVDWDGLTLTDVLADLIGHLIERGRRAGLTEAGTSRSSGFPTAAISVVRQRADVLELCLLGDAPVVFTGAGPDGPDRPDSPDSRLGAGTGPRVFTDPQYDCVEQELLSTVRADLDRGDSPATAYGRIHATLLDHRARRNTEAGSWILGDVPEAARHARSLSVPLTGAGDVLICSDGFGRLVEPFGLVDGYGALLAAVRAGAAEHLVARLREAELADPGRVRHPRFGVSDDASVVHTVLEPVGPAGGQAKGTTAGTCAAAPLQ